MRSCDKSRLENNFITRTTLTDGSSKHNVANAFYAHSNSYKQEVKKADIFVVFFGRQNSTISSVQSICRESRATTMTTTSGV